MPLLSIIIPSFNSLNALLDCIKSIQDQSFKDYEVIIIDAGSTDGTVDFLKTLNEPFSWVSEPDHGIYDAMNKGINLAQGGWLYFLGADDRIFDEQVLDNIFNKKIEEGVSLLLGKVKYDFKTKDSYAIKRKGGLFKPSWTHKIWLKNTVHHQGVFYNTSIFRILKYSLDYSILSDYHLNLTLFKIHPRIKYLDGIVAIIGTSGISKHYNWKLYREEVNLKANQSHWALKPIFFLVASAKYLFKQADL